MNDLTPNHPAVKAGCQAAGQWANDAPEPETDPAALALDTTATCLTAALPRLTADDIRHTPAGRALMAEAWERGLRRGYEDGIAQAEDMPPNPYRDPAS